MPVTERLMQAGSFSLKLSLDTPQSILDVLGNSANQSNGFFGHIYIFDGSLSRALADAAMIAAARWGGILRARLTPFDIGGVNMIAWLGDEDGKGAIFETTLGSTTDTFEHYIGFVLGVCPSVSSGTLTTVGGSKTLSYPKGTSPRACIDNLCALFGAEYRVNKDASFDVAPVGSSAMFKQTPTAVAMRRSSGREIPLTGLSVTRLDVSVDAEEYITRAAIQDFTTNWTFVAGAATPYKDLFGNAVKLTKPFVELLTPAAEAAGLGATRVAQQQVLRQQVTLATDEFDIDRDIVVGDNLYVYDVDGSMVDTTNPIHYRGSIIYPIVVRVLATIWPIERGMGVWYRDRNAAWTDITNYVDFEQPGATFEVGAPHRVLTKS